MLDERERMDAGKREADLFARLGPHLREACPAAPGLAAHLDGCDLDVRDRADLAKLPVLRKPDLMDRQAADPPFGGFVDESRLADRKSVV